MFIANRSGLFLYDYSLGKIKNIAKDLYLGDSLRLTVSKCPRIYTGLWHVGSYFINPNGEITMLLTAENAGGGVFDKDEVCNETVVWSTGFVTTGPKADDAKSEFMWNNSPLSTIQVSAHTLPIYSNGWWYIQGWSPSGRIVERINESFNEYELIYTNPDQFNFYIDNNSTFWLIRNKDSLLWYSKNLNNLQENKISVPLINEIGWKTISYINLPFIALTFETGMVDYL